MIKLLRFLKPYAAMVAATFLLVFLQAMSELYLPTLMADIVDNGIVKGDTDYILRVGGVMLLVAAGRHGLRRRWRSFFSRAGRHRLRPRRAQRGSSRRSQGFSLHEFDTLRHRHADHPHDQRHEPGAAGVS